jgi:hypothetical protein
MDATESAILSGYRTRIDAGEELPPQQFARYQDLVALEVRAFVGTYYSNPIFILLYRSYLIKLTPMFLLYIYFVTDPARTDPVPGM